MLIAPIAQPGMSRLAKGAHEYASLHSTLEEGTRLQEFGELRRGASRRRQARQKRPSTRDGLLYSEDGTNRCYSAALVALAALGEPIPNCRLVPACSLKLPVVLEKVAESWSFTALVRLT